MLCCVVWNIMNWIVQWWSWLFIQPCTQHLCLVERGGCPWCLVHWRHALVSRRLWWVWKHATWHLTLSISPSWMEHGASSTLLPLMFSFFSKLLLHFLSFKYSILCFLYFFFFFSYSPPHLLSCWDRLDRSFKNLNVVINLMEVLSAMLFDGAFQIC